MGIIGILAKRVRILVEGAEILVKLPVMSRFGGASISSCFIVMGLIPRTIFLSLEDALVICEHNHE